MKAIIKNQLNNKYYYNFLGEVVRIILISKDELELIHNFKTLQSDWQGMRDYFKLVKNKNMFHFAEKCTNKIIIEIITNN